jgi:hypothetical protein
MRFISGLIGERTNEHTYRWDNRSCGTSVDCCTGECDFMSDKLGQQSQEREWVGLTDEELNEHARWADEHGGTFYLAYARSIEAKLKEKNT